MDVYDVREAPNRRIKRLIENDNKKERTKERVKFNDKLIDLVYFVQKKDPRWDRFKTEDRRAKEEKKRAEDEKKRKAEAAH